MKESAFATCLRALALGAVAGMRSLTAPAILSWEAARRKDVNPELKLENTPFEPLTTPGVSNTLVALAVGEMVADKLPMTPSRTQAVSVAFRLISGAAVGSAVFSAERRNPAPGLLIGALGALAATYGMYTLRQKADKKLRAPDPLIGAVEDVIAVGSGIGALAGLKA
jgi:uncharacterized membrane protein